MFTQSHKDNSQTVNSQQPGLIKGDQTEDLSSVGSPSSDENTALINLTTDLRENESSPSMQGLSLSYRTGQKVVRFERTHEPIYSTEVVDYEESLLQEESIIESMTCGQKSQIAPLSGKILTYKKSVGKLKQMTPPKSQPSARDADSESDVKDFTADFDDNADRQFFSQKSQNLSLIRA